MTYILTNSGRRVGLEEGTPSIEDIALGLSRQPRFGGQTRRTWTVAHHSLFVADLAFELPSKYHWQSAPLELYALLHDAHEAVTGDVPTPFKGDHLKGLQQSLDARIFREHAPELLVDPAMFIKREVVKNLDNGALLVEALRVGPAHVDSPRAVAEHFVSTPMPRYIEIFDQYHNPPIVNIEGVFLSRYHSLRKIIQENF